MHKESMFGMDGLLPSKKNKREWHSVFLIIKTFLIKVINNPFFIITIL